MNGMEVNTLISSSLLCCGPEGLERFGERNSESIDVLHLKKDLGFTDCGWGVHLSFLSPLKLNLKYKVFECRS